MEKEKIIAKENYTTSVLITREQIIDRVKDLGREITNAYQDKDIVLVGALTGSFIFMADICREIELDLEIAFLQISSYGKDIKTSGNIKLISDIKTELKNRHVIIVEDIVDSGLSLAFLKKHLTSFHPASVKVLALLNKPSAHQVAVNIDYIGFNIANEFVIGYGLDFADKKRNLNNIYSIHFE
jgi:hypoxanthine phosphoribosyltransferase